MMAAVFIPLANLLLYNLRLSTWGAVGISVAIGGGATLLIYAVRFIWYYCNSKYLPDPPRRLGIRQQIKIIKYLELYGSNTPKGTIPRSFDLFYFPGVSDAEAFGRDIQDVMKRAGWAANLFDDNALSEPPTHKTGLWVYGKGKSGENPTTASLLVGAFKTVGFKVHVDPEHWGIPGTNLVIGFWE